MIFQYFDFDERKWKEIPQFNTPPYQTSLVAANDKLYALGAFSTGMNELEEAQCYEYDANQNTWKYMPPMTVSCADSLSVYFDGFIYQVGDGHDGRDVERFNDLMIRWEVLASIPERFARCVSALVCQGSILVYVLKKGHPRRDGEPCTHVILAYKPTTNAWQTLLKEEITFSEPRKRHPVLFVHQEKVYRILYKRTRSGNVPVVNILDLQSQENGITSVSVGEEIRPREINS